MKQNKLKIGLIISLLSCSLLITTAQAATGVGKAIISIGKVFTTSKDGKEKKLKRRGKVFEGDTITVGKKSRLQLRFIDNQLVVLKENTVFRIDEYKFKDKNDNNKSAALSLLKGGMRSVTGLIGKSARDKYKVRTPVATMGVRGTHYLLQVCSGDCGEGVQGLVGTVLEGEIEMTNEGGTSTFGTDQFFNVPSSNEAPRTMTNPPASLVSRAETGSDDDENNDDSGGDDEGDDSTLASDDGDDDPPADDSSSETGTTDDSTTTTETTVTSGEQTTVETTTGTVATASDFYVGSAAPVGAIAAVSGIANEVGGAGGVLGIQGVNGTINLETVNGVGNQLVNSSFSTPFGTSDIQVRIGAEAIDQGGDTQLGVSWGRWNSSDLQLTDESGGNPTLLTGLSFIYSDNPTPQLAIDARTDFTSYSLVAGPPILDEMGVGVSASLFIDVDFLTAEITDFYGSMSGNGRSYGVGIDLPTGVNVALTDLSNGGEIPIIASCSGCPAGITTLLGGASGAFVGSTAEGLIGYFGLSGSGTDTQGNAVEIGVSGSGVFVDIGGP